MTTSARDRERLVTENLGLVLHVARQFYRFRPILDDALGEARLMLVRAAADFDPDRGVKFSTYAGFWIRAAFLEYMRTGEPIVRPPGSHAAKNVFWHLARVEREIGDDPDRIAAHFGVTREELDVILSARKAGTYVSIDEESVGAQDGMRGRSVPQIASAQPSPEEVLLAAEDATRRTRRIARALRGLTAREREIVRLRWLLEEPCSQGEIGERLGGLSRQRVQQIEARAMTKLERRLRR